MSKLLKELTPDGVLLLTLNRPERMNAIDKELEDDFVSDAEHCRRQ